MSRSGRDDRGGEDGGPPAVRVVGEPRGALLAGHRSTFMVVSSL
jgi:hypothetical protein